MVSATQGFVFPVTEGTADVRSPLVGNLSTSGSTILDADGNGQVVFKTHNANQSWLVKSASVQTGILIAPVPRCGIYLNTPVSPGNLQAPTWSGSFDSATLNIIVGECDQLFITWTGGTPGDRATVSLGGVMATRR